MKSLEEQIKACRICVEEPDGTPLPHEPRPVVQLSRTARILISGQAPGTRVHQSGRPFTDPSGDRLREWLGVGEDVFYDPAHIAIVPMGLCFPGLDAKGGDLPPRKECARIWHQRIFSEMPQVELVLAIGQYAQKYHLGARRGKSLTATVANWQTYIEPGQGVPVLPLPHPSWRNNSWLKKHAWFEDDVLPALRQRVSKLIDG
ncbi:MAG: uracil-DNA glycosylase family protein [Rhodobacteraceae bacterium]|nr:uracil-DNA glycosylase family protein [Paracoccaceae bacterium]